MPLSPHPGLIDLTTSITREEIIDGYTALASTWVATGILHHTALVRIDDRAAVETLIDLGFGREQSYATRKTAHVTAGRPHGYVVRPAQENDLGQILPLTPLIAMANIVSPTFAALPAEFLDQLSDAHRREFISEHSTYLVAEDEGKVIGFAMINHSGTHALWPNPTAELTVAAVAPEHRGKGIGVALALAAINWSFDAGHTHISTDWRTANFHAERTWTRAGFTLAGWRMARVIPTPHEEISQ